MDTFSLVIPAFIAGIVTFLAPCTLPLVPGYLSFISGSSIADLQDSMKAKKARAKIFLNGVFYVIGFSSVFILLGTLFGLGGAVFFQYRDIIARAGGVFVILFGLFLIAAAVTALTSNRLNFLKIPPFSFFTGDYQPKWAKGLKPGNPFSSLVFGGTFALGWSPCVGPVLGAILTFAAASATVGQGAFLLLVFSAGLAIPFLLTALAIGWASTHLVRIGKYLNWVSLLGGIFLILLGIAMATNSFALYLGLSYQFLDALNIEYEQLLLDLL